MTRRSCFALALALLALLALVAIAAADCPIGWPVCGPDTISPAWLFAPVVMG
jgi:hypothetical protein